MMICDRWAVGRGGPLQLSVQLSIIYWCLFTMSIVLQGWHGNTYGWSEKVTLQPETGAAWSGRPRAEIKPGHRTWKRSCREARSGFINMIDDTMKEKTLSLHIKKQKPLLSTHRSDDMCKHFYLGDYFGMTNSVHLHIQPQRSLMNNVWRVNLNKNAPW